MIHKFKHLVECWEKVSSSTLFTDGNSLWPVLSVDWFNFHLNRLFGLKIQCFQWAVNQGSEVPCKHADAGYYPANLFTGKVAVVEGIAPSAPLLVGAFAEPVYTGRSAAELHDC